MTLINCTKNEFSKLFYFELIGENRIHFRCADSKIMRTFA